MENIKKLQLSTLAALLFNINHLESFQFDKLDKKTALPVVAESTTENDQSNVTYKQTIAKFNKLNLKYTNEVVAEDPDVLELSRNSDKIKWEMRKLDFARIWMFWQYTTAELNKIQDDFKNSDDNGLRKDLKIEWINDIKEYGVFATTNIPKDASIGIYAGTVRHESEDYRRNYGFESLHLSNKTTEDFSKNKPLVMGKMSIDASKSGNITRFINAPFDESEANCQAIYIMDKNHMPQILYVTRKEIKANEELTISYGENYNFNNKRS